jgi:hypothetical protein
MKDLPQPLRTWLKQSHLIPPINSVSVLIVDKESYSLISENISLLSKVYPLVKSIYPEMNSLHFISSGISFFINNNTITLHNVEVVQ